MDLFRLNSLKDNLIIMYIVSMTGASGAILGIRLMEELLKSGRDVVSVVSDSAWNIIHHEILRENKKISSIKDLLVKRGFHKNINKLREYSNNDFFSPIASGTTRFEAVIVVPCSMKTLSSIASGYSHSLINRVVDVALKEDRRCILVPRETPLNLIHIENMLQAKKAGADIIIPAPGFYTFPETIDDIINFIIGKILNILNIKQTLLQSWGEKM